MMKERGKMGKQVSGTIKPLVWVKHPTHEIWRCDTDLGTYKVFGIGSSTPSWDFDGFTDQVSHTAATLEAAKSAAQADYEARVLTQIQPDAGAYPVAICEAGEIGNQIHNLSCDPQASEAGELLPCPFCSSSQIEDVMRTGAVVCQDCRASATNNRQWNRRALPAARAEFSAAEVIPDHQPFVISEIGNYYGSLWVKREGGNDFWSIENYDGYDWLPCDPAVATAIRALTEAGQ